MILKTAPNPPSRPLSRCGSRGPLSKQKCRTLLFPGKLLLLCWVEAWRCNLPGLSLVCPGVPSWQYMPQTPKGVLFRCPTHLDWCFVEEQQFHSELLTLSQRAQPLFRGSLKRIFFSVILITFNRIKSFEFQSSKIKQI